MSLLSWFTGGGETVNKVVDGITDGVDAMFYTDEEKSAANQKILDFKLKMAQATTGQNVARRIIAIGIVALWVFLVLLAVFARIFNFDELALYIFNVLTDVVTTPFMVIIAFYFAAHLSRIFK